MIFDWWDCTFYGKFYSHFPTNKYKCTYCYCMKSNNLHVGAFLRIFLGHLKFHGYQKPLLNYLNFILFLYVCNKLNTFLYFRMKTSWYSRNTRKETIIKSLYHVFIIYVVISLALNSQFVLFSENIFRNA